MEKPRESTSAPDPTQTSIKSATWVMAFATLLSVAVLVFQWCAINRNLKLEERAWVVVENVKHNVDAATPLRVVFKNTGRGPALKVETRAYLDLDMKEAPTQEQADEILKSTPVLSESVVGGGVEIEVNVLYAEMPGDMATLFREGKAPAFLIGSVTYNDEFGEPHVTRYCLKRAAQATGFAPCSRDNSAN